MSSRPGFLPLCVFAQSPSHCLRAARTCLAFASYFEVVMASIITPSSLEQMLQNKTTVA